MDVNGKKMSKSLGNFYTLRHVADKGFDPLAYRFWTLTAHYRSPLNFTWKGLGEASANWHKIIEFYSLSFPRRLASLELLAKPKRESRCPDSKHLDPRPSLRSPEDDNDTYTAKRNKQFNAAMNDDLNTPKAIALLLQVIKDAHKNPDKISIAVNLIKKWDQVLGILPKKLPKKKKVTVPANVKKLLADRQTARQNKNFAKADKIRKKIEKLGFKVIDGVKKSKLIKG